MQPVFTSKWVCFDNDNLFQVCYSQQSRQYDIYIYIHILFVSLWIQVGTRGFTWGTYQWRWKDLLWCFGNCNELHPKHLSEAWPLQTGLESTILSPDVKTNSPMDRIVHISYHFIFWNIYDEPLVDLFLLGSAYLRIWVPAFVYLGPYCQKHFRKQTLCTVLGFGLETTTWFTTCYCHCD